jgi:hypothetical protein
LPAGGFSDTLLAHASAPLDVLRRADWLSPSRARAYLWLIAIGSVLGGLGYVYLSRSGLDPLGKPLGTDFASFWTASQLALSGPPQLAWSVESHRAAQAAMFGPAAGYAAFFYPPPYLLICLPLALMPYGAALAAWLTATGAAWVVMARRWLGRENGWLPILAFPAVLVNAGHGQNGFLSAALLGAAALLTNRKPWLAGALFGALVFKPHLAVLVPIFLILTGNWRAFLAAGAVAVGLCALSLAVFGWPAWEGFLTGSALAREALDQNLVGYAKMQSTFGAARLEGANLSLAWAFQGLTAAAGLAGLWATRRASVPARGAMLVCATLLTTPFLFDYDLAVLAAPLAFLFRQGRREGFLPWEKIVLAVGFVLPIVSRSLAMFAHLPIAPAVILLILASVLRRRGDQATSHAIPLSPHVLRSA